MSAVTVQAAVKKWYQSWIVRAGLALSFVGAFLLGQNLLFKTGVTPEQLDQVGAIAPDVIRQVNDAVQTQNWFGLLSIASGLFVTVRRVFFTTTVIPQSLPSK